MKVVGQETEVLRDGERDKKQPGYDAFSSLLPFDILLSQPKKNPSGFNFWAL